MLNFVFSFYYLIRIPLEHYIVIEKQNHTKQTKINILVVYLSIFQREESDLQFSLGTWLCYPI